MLSKARTAGMFCSKGVVLKCVSMSWAPFSRFSKCAGPTAKLIDKPTALHKEKRPPT